MSEQESANQSNLKDLLATLRETHSILKATENRLSYLATNTSQDEDKEESTPKGETATLESLHIIANLIARKTSNIAGHTSAIVGN